MDLDLYVIRDIIDLFEYPHGSAASDMLPYVFNSGVLVIEPSKSLYDYTIQNIPKIHSYNGGDQGFLNSIIDWKNNKNLHLPINYNFLSGFFSKYYLINKDIKIIHFTSEIKPWTYYIYGRIYKQQYELNFHQLQYYQWWSSFRNSLKGFNHAQYGVPSTETCMNMASKSKSNSGCTVLIQRFGESRDSLFQDKILPSLFSYDFIKMIVIGFGGGSKFNCDDENLPLDRIKCVPLISDSFTSRYSLVEHADTQCIIILDDDIKIEKHDLNFLYEIWKENPLRMIGRYARSIGVGDTYSIVSNDSLTQPLGYPYSMVLTKLLFIDSLLLENFICALPNSVYDVIQTYNQCEDIALNMFSLASRGNCPVSVNVAVHDYGTDGANKNAGISTKKGHFQNRTNCVRDFLRLFKLDRNSIQCYGTTIQYTIANY